MDIIIIIDILAEKNPRIQEIGGSLPTLTWAACGVASGNPAARRGSPLGHPSLPLRMGTRVGPVTQDHSFTHISLCTCWVFANESTIFPAYIYICFVSHTWTLVFILSFLKTYLFILAAFGLGCGAWNLRGSMQAFVIARKLPFSCGLRA